MKNQGNIPLPKDSNNLITKPKGIEFCDLHDNEFKIAVFRNLTSYKNIQKNNSMKSGNNT